MRGRSKEGKRGRWRKIDKKRNSNLPQTSEKKTGRDIFAGLRVPPPGLAPVPPNGGFGAALPLSLGAAPHRAPPAAAPPGSGRAGAAALNSR